MADSTVSIDVPVTVTMSERQVQEWARDNGVDPRNVPADVRSYILHNLLAGSRASEDYWTNVTVEGS